MKKKILVVDDHPGFAALLQRILPECEVRERNDSVTAIDAAKEWQPDLFLLDLSLPEKGGDELAAELAQDDRLRQVPIFYLSALVDGPEDGEPRMLHGHLAFGKPFKVEALRRHIANQFAASESQRACG